MKHFLLSCFAFFLISCPTISAFAQMTYIGLKDEANIRKAQQTLPSSVTYWNKTKIIDNYLYIPTRKGIYRKNLATTLNDTLWQPYAFPAIPVRDFIKQNNTLLAITANESNANLLLKSTDNGQTFSDITSSYFFNITPINTILQIAQNPGNPNSIVVVHRGYGISESNDLGTTWTTLNTFVGGYQDWYVGFNPNDPANIMYTGEEIFFKSFIQSTYDGGTTWKKVDSLQTHCTHGVAFHPTNKNIMISYGEGRIAKSIDQGLTWVNKKSLPLYIYKIIYDENNPDTLYASGDVNGPDNNIYIYRSLDGGETWHLSYNELLPDSDGVMDIHLYNNKLIIYTLINGVYFIDTNLLSTKKETLDKYFSIYPNPTQTLLYIESSYSVKNIKLYDTSGKLVLQKKVDAKENTLNVNHLASGIYHVLIDSDAGTVSRKIIKK